VTFYKDDALLVFLRFLSTYFFPLDGKRDFLQKPPRPAGSESPLEFDAYTLNHAAFVGTQETAWVTDFEQELTRRGVFVVKGAAQIMYRVRKSTMCPVCPLTEIFGQLCKIHFTCTDHCK
jgi:hypothetical protein